MAIRMKSLKMFLRTNAEGEIETVVEKREYKVYQRIYLSLQEDEVELANPLFRDIFNNLINYYQNETFSLEQYLMHLQVEFAQEVTDIILMEDERVILHNWRDKIFSKI
jgi:DNA primase